jgi:Flp pilus assembly protein TadD
MDETFSDGHLSLANVYLYQYADWPGAEHEIQRLELNPSTAKAHDIYSTYLMVMGRINEAVSESELALELDPLDSEMQVSLGYALGIAGMVDAAIVAQKKAVELDPTSPYPHEEMANLYEKKGMDKESIAESVMRIRLENDPREREDADFLERVYRARGFEAARTAPWKRRLERTVKESRRDIMSPWTWRACTHGSAKKTWHSIG